MRKITLDELIRAVERSTFGDEMVGFCLACGEEASNVEPDREGAQCEHCGAFKVMGAEQLLLRVQA